MLFKLFLLILPIYIQALTLGEFICQSAKICDRPPTIQEFCDIFDICFGVKKTPPTPIEILNKKLNLTEICNSGLSIIDIEVIQRDMNIIFNPPIVPTQINTLPSIRPITNTPHLGILTQPEPMTPEVITLIVLGSLTGLGLLVGLIFILKKKFIK